MPTENAFRTMFGNYVCVGDSIETAPDWRGLYYRARIMFDDSGDKPDERSDGFWPSRDPNAAGYVLPENFDVEQSKAERVMAAWKNDEWFYCGIVISAHIEMMGEQFKLSDHLASLWGIECNYPDSDNKYLDDTALELLSEAEVAGEEKIDALRRQVMKEAEQES